MGSGVPSARASSLSLSPSSSSTTLGTLTLNLGGSPSGARRAGVSEDRRDRSGVLSPYGLRPTGLLARAVMENYSYMTMTFFTLLAYTVR